MKRRIEIEKDDGGFDIVGGCSVEEFNRGGGLIITNNGKLPDNAISISVRIENGLTDSDQSYRLRFDVSPEEGAMEERIKTLSYSLQRTCSFLLGKEGFVQGSSSTYAEYEEDFNKGDI
jgi:hypothetical protein